MGIATFHRLICRTLAIRKKMTFEHCRSVKSDKNKQFAKNKKTFFMFCCYYYFLLWDAFLLHCFVMK